MNNTQTEVKIHFPFSPWKCAHGWDDEKEGKTCPACNGVCISCGENSYPLDSETGFCPTCEDIFESGFPFFQKDKAEVFN